MKWFFAITGLLFFFGTMILLFSTLWGGGGAIHIRGYYFTTIDSHTYEHGVMLPPEAAWEIGSYAVVYMMVMQDSIDRIEWYEHGFLKEIHFFYPNGILRGQYYYNSEGRIVRLIRYEHRYPIQVEKYNSSTGALVAKWENSFKANRLVRQRYFQGVSYRFDLEFFYDVQGNITLVNGYNPSSILAFQVYPVDQHWMSRLYIPDLWDPDELPQANCACVEYQIPTIKALPFLKFYPKSWVPPSVSTPWEE